MRRSCLIAGVFALAAAAGCAKDRLPATATQDPFLNSAQGRPASRVEPAPKSTDTNRGDQSKREPAKVEQEISANTTSRPSSATGSKPINATLMAPAETLSPSNAGLAMQNGSRTGSSVVQQAQWQSPAAPAGLDAALARLQQLGALDQRLELRGGQWTFSCDLPHATNPGQKRRYEGADASPLVAVRGVLDRIEAEPRPR